MQTALSCSNSRLILIGVLLMISSWNCLFAEDCATLQSPGPEELASYLSKVKRIPANDSCTAFAIIRLGEMRSEAAASVLTKFLDFTWPRGTWQKQRYFRDAPDPDGVSVFPAATALEKIGKGALPAILDAIKTPLTSKVGVETAVTVWMAMYKGQSPVAAALLKEEADKTKNPVGRQRLYWAAFKATQWCSPAEKAQCRAAILPSSADANNAMHAKAAPAAMPK